MRFYQHKTVIQLKPPSHHQTSSHQTHTQLCNFVSTGTEQGRAHRGIRIPSWLGSSPFGWHLRPVFHRGTRLHTAILNTGGFCNCTTKKIHAATLAATPPSPASPRLPGTHHVQHLLGPRIHLRHHLLLQRNRHRSTLDVQLVDVKNMVKATVRQYKKTTLLVIGTQRLNVGHLLHLGVQCSLHW